MSSDFLLVSGCTEVPDKEIFFIYIFFIVILIKQFNLPSKSLFVYLFKIGPLLRT